MVNKSPVKYGQKINEDIKNESIDGRNNETFTFKGLPQHIKLPSYYQVAERLFVREI